MPGPETEALAGLSRRTGASLVVGVIERGGSTLYCTALYFDPRPAWSPAPQADAHGHRAPDLGPGRWLHPAGGRHAGRPRRRRHLLENHMPPLRAAMYAKGVQIWCAPTVDERDIWQCSMRHIAHEGRAS